MRKLKGAIWHPTCLNPAFGIAHCWLRAAGNVQWKKMVVNTDSLPPSFPRSFPRNGQINRFGVLQYPKYQYWYKHGVSLKTCTLHQTRKIRICEPSNPRNRILPKMAMAFSTQKPFFGTQGKGLQMFSF